MAFHSGESSPPPHSPAPFLWPEAPLSPAKDPLSTTHCVVQESMKAARLLSLTRLVRCCCLTEASAVPGNVWVISSDVTLLAVQTSFFCTKKKKAWVSDKQQTALCPTAVVKNPSYPSVNQGGSSRVKKKKMPGICNPRTLGLKLCSFFYLALHLQLSVCSMGPGFKSIMYPDGEGPLQASNGCVRTAHLLQISSFINSNIQIWRIYFEFAPVAIEFRVINCFDITPVAMATLHRH